MGKWREDWARESVFQGGGQRGAGPTRFPKLSRQDCPEHRRGRDRQDNSEGRPSIRRLSGLCFIFLVCFQITEQINRRIRQTTASRHFAKHQAAFGGPTVSLLLWVFRGGRGSSNRGKNQSFIFLSTEGGIWSPPALESLPPNHLTLILEPPWFLYLDGRDRDTWSANS